jgi:hypothetical protein
LDFRDFLIFFVWISNLPLILASKVSYKEIFFYFCASFRFWLRIKTKPKNSASDAMH